MKWSFILGLLLLCRSLLFAQQPLETFNQQRIDLSRKGMLVLGSWGAANMISGAIGMTLAHREAYYFHQMNCIWGATNLLIAAPSYFSARHRNTQLSLSESVRQQSGIEKLFLINAGLDLAYIGTGVYCLQKASNDSRKDLYNGYGKSLVLQGAGLLIFDLVMTTLHQQHGKKLYKILKDIQVSPGSASITWKF